MRYPNSEEVQPAVWEVKSVQMAVCITVRRSATAKKTLLIIFPSTLRGSVFLSIDFFDAAEVCKVPRKTVIFPQSYTQERVHGVESIASNYDESGSSPPLLLDSYSLTLEPVSFPRGKDSL